MFDLGVAAVGVGCFAGVDVGDSSKVVPLKALDDALGLTELFEGRFGEVPWLAAVEVLGDEGKGCLVAHSLFVLHRLKGGYAGLVLEGGEGIGFGDEAQI